MGFIGSYKHTLDPKGRVFVPKKILAKLPENEPRQFTVTRGFEQCLTLFTQGAWQDHVDLIKGKAQGDEETRHFKRILFALAVQQPIDSSGRILIPEELREQAGLQRDVVFVGMEDMVELWDAGAWKSYSTGVSPDFEKHGQKVLKQ